MSPKSSGSIDDLPREELAALMDDAARVRRPSHNSIFDYLARRAGRPSSDLADTLVIGLMVGGCGCILLLAVTHEFSRGAEAILTLVVFLVSAASFLAALMSPFVSAVITATGTAQDAAGDVLSLLKLTHVTAQTIVLGYVRLAVYRLRLLWLICYGLLPPLWAVLVVRLGSSSGSDPFKFLAFDAIWPAFWIVLCGAALGTSLNWLAVCVGVNAALRWRNTEQSSGAAAGAVLAAFIVLGMGLFCGSGVILARAEASSVGTLTVVLCLVIATVYVGAGVISLQSARVKL